MIVAQMVPEQIFERRRNYWLEAEEVADFPAPIRDLSDTEPVTIVKNTHIDVDHTVPDGSYGFVPLNAPWHMKATRLGGRYFKGQVGATYDADREKIWTVDRVDPK